MAGDERQGGFERPIATRGMKIGVAYATVIGLYEDLAQSRSRELTLREILSQETYRSGSETCGRWTAAAALVESFNF